MALFTVTDPCFALNFDGAAGCVEDGIGGARDDLAASRASTSRTARPPAQMRRTRSSSPGPTGVTASTASTYVLDVDGRRESRTAPRGDPDRRGDRGLLRGAGDLSDRRQTSGSSTTRSRPRSGTTRPRRAAWSASSARGVGRCGRPVHRGPPRRDRRSAGSSQNNLVPSSSATTSMRPPGTPTRRPSGRTPATRRSARRSTPIGPEYKRPRRPTTSRYLLRSRSAHRRSAIPTSSAGRQRRSCRMRTGGRPESRPPS